MMAFLKIWAVIIAVGTALVLTILGFYALFLLSQVIFCIALFLMFTGVMAIAIASNNDDGPYSW